MPEIEQFDAVRITNASIQVFEGGTQQTGTKFGCIGQLEGETELRTLIKRCEGYEVENVSKPDKMNMTVSAHIPVKVARDLFGLSSQDLKPGVWSYGTNSKGKKFIFTADIVDEFQDQVKLVAFANCRSTTGLKLMVENGADELAELEIEFTAMKDDTGQIYYEAIISELTDQTIKDTWHKTFNRALVEEIPAP